MKTAALAIALLMSGAAIAQTYTQPDVAADADLSVKPDGAADVAADVDASAETNNVQDNSTPSVTTPGAPMASMTPASGPVLQPGNVSPERDARGIAVISAPAMVPAGWNGITGSAMGGPLVDPATGQTIDAADDSYPACSATVTDNCLQTYEKGRTA